MPAEQNVPYASLLQGRPAGRPPPRPHVLAQGVEARHQGIVI